MGLASSQARMLLLTARKSDLEFRAQQITNSTMILAMQTEEVARKYSTKLSNQTLRLIDPNTSKEQTFNASTLVALTTNSANPMHLEIRGKDGEYYPWKPQYDRQYQDENGKIFNASDLSAEQKAKYSLVSLQYQDKDGNVVDEKYYNDHPEDKEKYSLVLPKEGKIINDWSAQEILVGMKSGTCKIFNSAKTEITTNSTSLSEGYYTEDDAAAEADYKRQTASIQIKEKRLQMDLQQVETQQKACDTEMDSVKKIMDKNIERTFKVFS